MAAASNKDQFLELLRRSSLLDAAKLDTIYHSLGNAPADRPKDAADRLVHDGVLTSFQARLLLAGKYKGFLIAGGKYKLLEILGVGGMGKVYLCEHLRMHRLVAVKVLPAEATQDATAVERFNREARAAASLDHINIVRAHDIDSEGAMHFLVMEYVDGSSLQEVVKLTGPMDVVRACHYISQAAAGLEHAHEAGWVHRDIKPGNLLLDRTGCVKILDMGLARCFIAAGGQDAITKLHNQNSVLGTADYLSPEQAVSSGDVDIRADIYSLGATFYFLLTGRAPFEEGSIAEKLVWHQMRMPSPVRQHRPNVPAELEAVVAKMMAKKPAQRYQTPGEVMAALEPWTTRPIDPPPESEMPRRCLALEQYHTPLPSGPITSSSSQRLRMPRFGPNSSSYQMPAAAPPPPPTPAKRWPLYVGVGGAMAAAVVTAVLVSGVGSASKSSEPKPPVAQVRPPAHAEPPPAEGGTVVVHKAHAGDGSAYATLADAVAAAKPGQAIVLRDETVEGPIAITDVNRLRGLRIQSDLPGGRSVMWRPKPGQSPAEPLVRVAGVADVRVIGMTFDGQRSLQNLIELDGPCPGFRLDHAHLTDFRGSAVVLNGAGGSEARPISIDHCRFTTARDYTAAVNFTDQYVCDAAIALRVGRDGSDCRHVRIAENRFEGMYRGAITVACGTDADVRLNRFYTLKDEERPPANRDCWAVRLSAGAETPVQLNLASNTVARYPALLRLESLPAQLGSRVTLRSNLMVGGTAWAALMNAGDAAKVQPLFDGSAGNVCRPGTCGKGPQCIPRTYIAFKYFDVSLASDALFLRYRAKIEENGQVRPHELLTAGANGEPAGVPPAS